MIISPSILSADFANLESEIKKVQKFGIEWFHLDVMDGHFVPNITIGAPVVKDIRKIEGIFLDTHLMISNPEKYADDFISAGSDLITFHVEATKDKTDDLIKYIKSKGAKVGLSIKPKTQPEAIEEYIKELDLVLVMTVEPGFGGQKFMEDCATKLIKLSEYKVKYNKDLILQVDGGINNETAKICKKLGANSLVAGNYIYKSENIEKALKNLS